MRPRVYAITATLSLASVVLLRQLEPKPLEEEVNIIPLLPQEVQVLLPQGLCDNIHNVFLMEVQTFPHLPQAQRQAAQERILYYRNWLQRTGCG